MFDATLAGFVARASLGTLADLLPGQAVASPTPLRNWAAVLSLPLVFLMGLLPDFWRPIERLRTRRSEHRRPPSSSFRSGIGRASPRTEVSRRRGRSGIRPATSPSELQAAAGPRTGIGRARHRRVARRGGGASRDGARWRRSRGRATAGVRMHWLYFDERLAGPPRGCGIRLRLDVRVQRRRRVPRGHLAGLSPAGESSA